MLTSVRLNSHSTVASKRIAIQHGGLCSTGILRLEPGSTNVIPGEVTFTLDMRHARSDEALREMEAAILSEAQRIVALEQDVGEESGRGRPCQLDYTVDSVAPLAKFHPDCIQAVRDASLYTQEHFADLDASSSAPSSPSSADWTLDLTSGAGHDTCATSTMIPSTMIFAVSERDGVSHHPTEYTTPDNCAIGAQTLLGALLYYDKLREERGE